MTTHRRVRRTELFLLRIWVDDRGLLTGFSLDEHAALRGRLQRVVDGEAHEFQDWHSLKAALGILLARQEDGKGDQS